MVALCVIEICMHPSVAFRETRDLEKFHVQNQRSVHLLRNISLTEDFDWIFSYDFFNKHFQILFNFNTFVKWILNN